MSTDRATALVRKWAPRFGLGEFRLAVNEIPRDTPDAWARSFYDIEELWGVLDLPGDEFLPVALQELLILHELAHGLLQLAESGDVGCEQACNRIARLARGDFETPLGNEHHASVIGEDWFDEKFRNASVIDKRAWLNIVTAALPEQERAVINLLYFEGVSYRDAAAALHIDVHTVWRRRDKAIERLRKYYDALEGADFHTARKLIELRQPEGGAEHEVLYQVHHRCSQANALHIELGNDIDLLFFPVGNAGYTMPLDVPFSCTSLDECHACGQLVGCWFVWRAGHVSHPGEIWTP